MSRREDIRNYLKMQSDGASTGRIAEALCCTTDQARDALKNMRVRGEVCKDDLGRWYWDGQRGFVPEGATVRREPVVKMPLAALDEPQEIVELAEHMDKVSVVPTAELEKPAVDWDDRDEMPEIRIELQIPTWVARRVMDVLEQASRESKAAGRLWGTET